MQAPNNSKERTVMAFARTLRKFKIVYDRYWFYKDLMCYWLHIHGRK